jgi:hypothetical protein
VWLFAKESANVYDFAEKSLYRTSAVIQHTPTFESIPISVSPFLGTSFTAVAEIPFDAGDISQFTKNAVWDGAPSTPALRGFEARSPVMSSKWRHKLDINALDCIMCADESVKTYVDCT